MRRPQERVPGIVHAKLLDNYAPEQLRLIGSVAILYNGCEHVLQNAAGYCIHFTGPVSFITSKISGSDGLAQIILESVKLSKFIDAETKAAVDYTLKGDQGFSVLKAMRDAVVHSMPYNVKAGIGRSGAKGKRWDVLTTIESLNWLTDALEMLRQEMSRLGGVLRSATSLERGPGLPARRAQLEVSLRSASRLFHEAQHRRQAMSAPPTWPSTSEIEKIALQLRVRPGLDKGQ